MSERVEVMVEVPKGSRNKYTRMPGGVLRLERVLYSFPHYPAGYGIVEAARAAARALTTDEQPP
jgi:inorganic pyrophosphatase